MSLLGGRAKKYDGTAIDYVSIFNWSDGKCIAQVKPDASGAWEWEYFFDLKVGITYVADGCEPVTHGSYSFIDTDNMIKNGNFKNDLSHWATPSGIWKWSNGRAHYPSNTVYSELTQSISSSGSVRIRADIEVTSGRAEYFVVSSGVFLYPATELEVGVHKIDFISPTNSNARLYFSRVGGIGNVDFYVDNVIVTQV